MFKIPKLLKFIVISWKKRNFCTDLSKFKPPYKVLFFGTDQFSLASIQGLTDEYRKKIIIDRLEVATTFRNKQNPVYAYGIHENLILHQWPLKDEIKGFDLGLVVSFGYLIPERIINSFALGMLNVHASLLPRWRGASPTIYALAKGDTKTGISIMKIKPKHFDTGDILKQDEIEISNNMTHTDLHNNLSELGANSLIDTLYNLPKYYLNAQPQSEIGVTKAPKINSNFANINFHKMVSKDIYNLSRALEGLYPLNTKFGNLPVKLYKIKLCSYKNDEKQPGCIIYDRRERDLKVMCADRNFVSIKAIGVLSKKIITAEDFNNGYLKKLNEKEFY